MNTDPRTWPIVEVCDPAMKKGLYLIWACVNPEDFWFVVQAAHIPDAAFSIMCGDIKRWRGYLPRQPSIAIMDRRGGAHVVNQETKDTWFTKFREHGLNYVESTEGASTQHLHDWLRPQWHPQLSMPVPKLRICQSVAEMKEGPVWALQRYIWDPFVTKPKQYQQPGKDWIDDMKYLAAFPNLTFERLNGLSAATKPGLAAGFARKRMVAGPSWENINGIIVTRGSRSGRTRRNYW